MENKKSKTKTVSNLILIICLVGILSALCYFTYKTKLENDEMRRKVVSLEQKINTKKEDSNYDERINILDNAVYFINMQHRIENGTVTDDFVVEKITIHAFPSKEKNKKGILFMTADLSNQPSMSVYYKGSGQYSLTDRELKGKLKDVADKIEEQYRGTEKFITGAPTFDEGSLVFTVKNYEVAKYENGSIKLKGEY